MRAYAIRHKPTGKFMPTRMYRTASGGWSHWLPLADGQVAPDGWYGCDGFDKSPRLFFSPIGARNALTAWLSGVHATETEDQGNYEMPEMVRVTKVQAPPVARRREDMEIVAYELREVGQGEHLGHMYLATNDDGLVVAMSWDEPDRKKETAREIAQLIRQGYHVNRIERRQGDPMPKWVGGEEPL